MPQYSIDDVSEEKEKHLGYWNGQLNGAVTWKLMTMKAKYLASANDWYSGVMCGNGILKLNIIISGGRMTWPYHYFNVSQRNDRDCVWSDAEVLTLKEITDTKSCCAISDLQKYCVIFSSRHSSVYSDTLTIHLRRRKLASVATSTSYWRLAKTYGYSASIQSAALALLAACITWLAKCGVTDRLLPAYSIPAWPSLAAGAWLYSAVMTRDCQWLTDRLSALKPMMKLLCNEAQFCIKWLYNGSSG